MKNFFSRLSGRLLLLGFTATLGSLTAGSATAASAKSLLSPQAVPTVNSFNPTSGAVGTSVNISGTGFTGTTSVTFNNVAATTFSVNSGSSISATVPAGASSGRIRVINADGTGVSATNFTVVQPPTITSFTPATARVGQVVTVNGARLTGALDVALNGMSVAFTQVSGTRVTFTVPVGATSGFITVTTANGTATSATQFVVRPDLPTITSFTPASGAAGVTSVAITGTNFTGATTVSFNNTAASIFTVNSATSITATVPVGATTGRIRVITPGGTAASATSFTIAGPPTITSISPTQGAPGSSIIIRGTNYVNVSSVQFNGATATFTRQSNNRLTAVVPAGATTGPITVTTPSGTATSGTFTVNLNAPTITSFTPASGNPPPVVTNGTLVTINGSNFVAGAGNTTVFFNGTQSTTVTFVNVNRVRARVPVGATSGPISVTTGNGTAISGTNFTIANTPPTITGTATQRGCANSQLIISYTVGDAQTPVNDLTVAGSSPGAGTIIVFTADNSGSGANRTALVDAVDPNTGGSTTLTLTVTDGNGASSSLAFNITLDPVVTANAGSDQTQAANQPVAVSGTATHAASTLWTSSGTGTFDNAAAATTNYNPSQADYMAGTVTLTFTASPAPVGSACSAASDALMVTFSRPDRTVTGNETLSGVYNNVLVTAGAVATTGTLDIAGSLGVQNGGRLAGDGACAPITGSGTFTLEDGAQLDICHSQGIALSGATGQIRVTGTRSYGAGATYAYVGSGAQNSGNGLPFNLTGTLITNNGGAGVDLTNGLRLHNRLRLINGDLRIGESASLTVVSNATGTGVIENQSGVVVGSATIQRYLESSLSAAVGYHHLSSPVTAAPVSDLNTAGFTAVVNPLYNTAINPQTVLPYPTVFAYDEQRQPTGGGFSAGYFSPALVSSPLEPGHGYSVYINGGLTPDFVGTPNNGTITRAGLTRTGNFIGPGQKSGWHLFGNPYPSPIDWDLATVPAGMSTFAFVFRSTGGLNGSYVSYENGAGAPGTDLIGLGQGFFVRVTGVGPVNFSFTNACRVTNTNVPVFRTAGTARPQLALSLRSTSAPAIETAETHVYFQGGATAGYDPAFDGARPARNIGMPTLATVVADEELAVNTLAPEALTAGTRLSLLVDVPAAGTYELAVQELTNLAGTDVYLLDALTGTAQQLTAAARYRFTAAVAGEQSARFALRFGAAGDAPAAVGLHVWPNPATGRAQVRLSSAVAHLTLTDALGRTVRTLALGAGQTDATLDLHNLPAGVYILRAGATTTRLVVE